jgi:hypothetical protein
LLPERDLHVEDDLSPLASISSWTNSAKSELSEFGYRCHAIPLPLQAGPPPTLDFQRNAINTISLQASKPRLTDLGNNCGIPDAGLFLTPPDHRDTSVPMTGMARHGSVGAFSGFSVCQPALGASLQWLPAIGTAELDDMINAFLPGPASIQDKRAHISMDFFEFSRQTGENFKFYPVPSGSFTPVTASPATSALYDSGYASSFNHSPVLSEQGSWTQSPAPFAPAASGSKPRSSASKRSSTSSSRQQTVDFANHPGMRILTKDGRDVTNSASRGCKTKEQRDHAHLMRIIKACDACKKKKVRCDPSHRKRNASQTSATQTEQKPTKKAKKADEPAPVAVANAAADFTAADPFAAESLSFPSFDIGYPQDSEEFWNEFVALDQEPVAIAPTSTIDDLFFDSFTDVQSFFSPTPGSTATSPSHILTPITPERSDASPAIASDYAIGAPGEFSLEDPAVPYLNPGVAHGTNYLDFNLYSPGPELFDEDPVLQMRDLGSQQHSPQSTSPGTQHSAQASPTLTSDVSQTRSTGELHGGENHTVTAVAHDDAWYYDPGDTLHDKPQPSAHHSPTNLQLSTNHNRVIDDGDSSHSRCRHISGGNSDAFATLIVQSSVSQSSAPTVLGSVTSTSTVVANVTQSSVSPTRAPRPRRVTSASAPPGGALAPPGRSPASTQVSQNGKLDVYAKASPSTAAPGRGSLGCTTKTATETAFQQYHKVVGSTARASSLRFVQSCTKGFKSQQLVTRRASGSPTPEDEKHATQQATAAVNATLATMLFSTLPKRRDVAGEDVHLNAFFFQLAVFGLVSFLCASALQAHLANQVNLVNILAITSISLARLAPRCSGPSSATWVASEPLQPPTPSGILNNVKLKVQSVVTGLEDLKSSGSWRARSSMPRLPTVRLLRL